MSYEVKIIADSVAPHGARLTTFQLRYPRFIHAEFMTHRAISRNASSTRAIPMAKQLQAVNDDPAMPVYWGKNQKGMQATQELSAAEREAAIAEWLSARDEAVDAAEWLTNAGIHKQIAGRILEPWAHISVVATATSEGWANFFALRCHPAAMPEIQALAVPMARAYRDSAPRSCAFGEWHLPYVLDSERGSFSTADLAKVSTARCARVSYLTHDGENPDFAKDIQLHDTLESNGHWSPPEHPGWPASDSRTRSGNFVGWFQYRQMLVKSVHNTFDFATLDRFDGKDFIV